MTALVRVQTDLNPSFGQQQQSLPLQLQYSIPTGGFLGQNQIGGQSGINVYKRPPAPELTPRGGRRTAGLKKEQHNTKKG